LKIVAGYPSVKLIHQNNQGLSAARNAGLGASEGNYLVFLDADDRLLPNALDEGIKALDAHPDCSFVFGRCRVISKDGLPVASGPQPRIESQYYLELLRDNYIWNPAQVMYRREVFESIGAFNPGISAAADYDLYLRIARNFHIHNHYKIIAEYRQHDQKYVLELKAHVKDNACRLALAVALHRRERAL
jgi:glycosyltransferase involved in cell wall biosynthesis